MGCEQYRELISALLDGELAPEDRAALDRHLQSCADCAAVYQGFMALSGVLAEDLEEPPESLRANVMAELRREQIRKANRRAKPLRGVLVAAACAALLLGVTLSQGVLRRDAAVSEDQLGLKLAGSSFPVSRSAGAAEEAERYAESEEASALEEAANGALYSLAAAPESAAAACADSAAALSLEELLDFLDGEPSEDDTGAQALCTLTVDGAGAPCKLELYALSDGLLCRLPDGTLLRSAHSEAELEAFLAERG